MDVAYPFTLKFMFISSFEGLLIKLQWTVRYRFLYELSVPLSECLGVAWMDGMVSTYLIL